MVKDDGRGCKEGEQGLKRYKNASDIQDDDDVLWQGTNNPSHELQPGVQKKEQGRRQESHTVATLALLPPTTATDDQIEAAKIKPAEFYSLSCSRREHRMGRSLQCDLVVPLLYVSRFQCVITVSNTECRGWYDFTLEDTSSNGTLINDVLISKKTVPLHSGDEICFPQRSQGQKRGIGYVFEERRPDEVGTQQFDSELPPHEQDTQQFDYEISEVAFNA